MTTSENQQLLRAEIFEDIPESAVNALCARGRTMTFDSGQRLFDRGGSAEELMILRDGIVELIFPVVILGAARDLTLESKKPGDLVAWSALVRPYHFTLSARCASECTLTVFSRDDLHAYFLSDPLSGYSFMRNLAGVIGRRLQAMQNIWTHDLQASAAKRME